MLQKERLAALVLCVWGYSSLSAQGWVETGDAGDTLETAQVLDVDLAIETISGRLEADADVYRIVIEDPAAFSAVVESTDPGFDFDTQLFLFDENGHGVISNDDSASSPVPFGAAIDAGHEAGPTSAGTYYLAVSFFDWDPYSAVGAMFPNVGSGTQGPTADGGAAPLENWGAGLDNQGGVSPFVEGDYVLRLTSVRGSALVEEIPFHRGDASNDGHYNVADPVATLNYLFRAAPAGCLDAHDANDDGSVDVDDAMLSLSYLFSGGAAPPAPFLTCDVDPTDDTLDCSEYNACSDDSLI